MKFVKYDTDVKKLKLAPNVQLSDLDTGTQSKINSISDVWWVYLPLQNVGLSGSNTYIRILPQQLGADVWDGTGVPFTGRYRFNVFMNYGLKTSAGGQLQTTMTTEILSVDEVNQAGAHVWRNVDITDYLMKAQITDMPMFYKTSMQGHGTVRLNQGDPFKFMMYTADTLLKFHILSGYVELQYIGDIIQGEFI